MGISAHAIPQNSRQVRDVSAKEKTDCMKNCKIDDVDGLKWCGTDGKTYRNMSWYLCFRTCKSGNYTLRSNYNRYYLHT